MASKICKSPWCRVSFQYSEEDMIESVDDDGKKTLNPPKTCPKCRSFDSELSGGVTWTDKEYEGSRTYFEPQPFKYKITKYR